MRVLNIKINENKNSEKNLNKIGARFAEGKQKMNNLKIKFQECQSFKEKLNNMEQVQTKY